MDLQDLPKSLQKAIEDMEMAWAKVDQGEDCLSWDCCFCELQSSINSAAVNGVISSEAAWQLREKYLRMERPAPLEANFIHQTPGTQAPAILLLGGNSMDNKTTTAGGQRRVKPDCPLIGQNGNSLF